MLRAVGVSRGFAGQPLFERVDWFIGDRDRIGLVGPNGSGKSTWLKMLTGLEAPDEGRFEQPKGQRVGYLPQFSFDLGRGTVREEAKAAFASVLELKSQLEVIERELDQSSLEEGAAAQLLDRYSRIEEQFRHRDGYDIDRQVDRVLRGLGFSLEDFDRPVETFSGGWRMRVTLARLLLAKPDVLLLDEPTNHLDLEAREWLESFLRDYPGAFVVVSHDRYFLDETVTRITEIQTRQMHDYSGNYSRYLQQRESRYEMALKAWERQQEEIARIQRFIDRFRAKNTKATQVQSRIKMLEKMPKLEKPVAPSKSVRFRFPQPGRSARIALELSGVTKRYGSLEVLRAVDVGIERGQKIALVGPNGAGKSTLMKVLAGDESFQEGERTVGSKVSLDYFAQDAADRMPQDRTILEHAMSLAPVDFVPQVRGLLGAFLFSGESVDKRIGVLSGGERNRLALALMLMHPANVLLLDEPTNHLDMGAKDVLLSALESFDGTVVFVSHDRYFLEALADRVIEVGGGSLYDYPGGFADFDAHKEAKQVSASEAVTAPRADRVDGRAPSSGSPPPVRKATPRKVRAVEDRIAQLEARKSKLETLLADGQIYQDAEKSTFYMREYQDVTADLDRAMEDWAELSERLQG